MKCEHPSLYAALLVGVLVNVLLRSQTAYWCRAGAAAALVCAPVLAAVGALFAVSWQQGATPLLRLLFALLLAGTSVLELLRLWNLTQRLYPGAVTQLALCLLVLLALPLRYLAQSSSLSDRVFRHPLAGAAVTFILMWAMIFLPSYTMGGIGAGRLLNVVWMTFILGLAVTEFLLFGWLERIRGVCLTPAIRQLSKAGKCLPLVCAAMLVCMACIGSHTVKEGQDNHFATTLEAAYELADGEAARFAKVLDKREAILTDTDQPDVVIRPLTEEERPWLLFYTDVAPGPDLWGLTPYYSKNSVTIADYNN